MQSALVELWPFLLIFYLVDGFRHLGVYEFGLSSFSGITNRFRFISPGSFFLNTLPGGMLIRADQRPIIFTKSSLYLMGKTKTKFSAIAPSDFVTIDWTEIQTVSVDGKNVLLNGEKRLIFSSNIRATSLANQINSLLNAPNSKRQTLCQKFYRQHMDLKLAQAEWIDNRNALLGLLVLSQTLFILLLLLLPLRLYTDLLNLLELGYLLYGILLTFVAAIGAEGYTSYRIYGLSLGKVTTEMLLMLISPLSAPQALLSSSSNLLHGYDWLVVSAILRPKAHFYADARERLHHINKMQEGGNDAVWSNFWQYQEGLVLNLIEQADTSIEAIYQPPNQKDGASDCYCPVCHSEYIAGFDMCPDCDMMLAPFPA